MIIRSRGIHTYYHKPGEIQMTSTRFRRLYENGHTAEAIRPINEAMWAMGYGSCRPDYLIEDRDLSPGSIYNRPATYTPPRRWIPDDDWRHKVICDFSSNSTVLRHGRRVADYYGLEYILRNFCPVVWEPNISSDSIMFHVENIVSKAFGDDYLGTRFLTVDNIAVTEQQLIPRSRDIRTVVWLRYSYLQQFSVGQQLINVYRMMTHCDTIYGIPRYDPHR